MDSDADQQVISVSYEQPLSVEVVVPFVKWLIDEDMLGFSLPECWVLHPFIVSILSALAISWAGCAGEVKDASRVYCAWWEDFDRLHEMIKDHVRYLDYAHPDAHILTAEGKGVRVKDIMYPITLAREMQKKRNQEIEALASKIKDRELERAAATSRRSAQ